MANKADKDKKNKVGDTKIDDLDYRVNQTGDVEQISQDESLLSEAINNLLDILMLDGISSEQKPWEASFDIHPFTPQLIGQPSSGEPLTNMTGSGPVVDDLDNPKEKHGFGDNEDPFIESMCGTGAIGAGPMPMLFKPQGYVGDRKKKKKGKKKELDFAIDGLLQEIVR
jgi:hypothetical protein